MAFLDNSGDIILDAVLTDEGRRRLAMGDGSFRITKFALGDDEIDYSLYDKTPANGTGYEDTRILQLPVFEAFTNNTTSLKNRVISYDDNSLLYLPVVKLNNLLSPTTINASGPVGGYFVSVDSSTTTLIGNLDTTPSFIDDDNIATYMFAIGKDSSYFAMQKGGTGGAAEPSYSIITDTNNTRVQNSVIGPGDQDGRYGSRLVFGLRSSLNLQTSQNLFTRLGATESIIVGSTETSFSTINTVVRITGFTTGYRVEVPLKLLKYTS